MQDLVEQFTSAFVAGAKELKYGDPKDPETDVSVMIDQVNADRVETWVNEAVAGGATVLCGGKKEEVFICPP